MPDTMKADSHPYNGATDTSNPIDNEEAIKSSMRHSVVHVAGMVICKRCSRYKGKGRIPIDAEPNMAYKEIESAICPVKAKMVSRDTPHKSCECDSSHRTPDGFCAKCLRPLSAQSDKKATLSVEDYVAQKRDIDEYPAGIEIRIREDKKEKYLA